jgi:hypothetical protein
MSDWVDFGDRIQIVSVGPWNGFEILDNGEVWLIEDDVRRRASRLEAIQTRQAMRFAMGESIADAAGLEPE